MQDGMLQLPVVNLQEPAAQLEGCVAAHPEGFVVEPDGTLQKCWDTVGQPEFAVPHSKCANEV